MAFEQSSLDIHAFLRYAIPGYIFIVVLVFPTIHNKELWSTVFTEWHMFFLVLLAGPATGFMLYHVYNLVFQHAFYCPANGAPFKAIRKHLHDENQDIKNDDVIRALYDLIYFSERNKWISDRVNYLFSSFHSLGASATAILCALVLWIILPSFVGPSFFSFDIRLINTVGLVLIGVIAVFCLSWRDKYNLSKRVEEAAVLHNLYWIRYWARLFLDHPALVEKFDEIRVSAGVEGAHAVDATTTTLTELRN